MTTKASVVIPVYNNANALEALTRRLRETLSEIGLEWEVIFVNDGSKDNSLALLTSAAELDQHIKVIELSRNFGQHKAICAGFEAATGDAILLMDADLQDRPEDIPELINRLDETDADVVYTIKESADKVLTSRMTSVLFHLAFSRIIGASVPINIGTFRCFNRVFLDAILQFQEQDILYGPLMFFIGFRSTFVTLDYDEGVGTSSYTFLRRLRLAVSSIVSYTDLPHQISLFLGSAMILGTIIYAGIIAIQYAAFGSALPDGITLILMVLCLSVGSIMMFLGVIGGYIYRVYQEVLRRPRYLVRSRVNFESNSSKHLETHVVENK